MVLRIVYTKDGYQIVLCKDDTMIDLDRKHSNLTEAVLDGQFVSKMLSIPLAVSIIISI